MTSLTRLAVRHPRRTVFAWLVAAAVLAGIGHGIEDRLEPTRLILPGTTTAAWDELRHGVFGDETVVLLQGPPAAIDAQGPRIASGIAAATGAPLVSPWSGVAGVAERLRPQPRLALVIIDVSDGEEVVAPERLRLLEGAVDRLVDAPLTGTVTGAAPLARAITDETLGAAAQAELIALPILMLVLLLVFRSPAAALIPLIVAGATVVAGRGALVLLTPLLHLDATAAVLLSMIGLALGVDYSLLIVTRYREARGEGDGIPAAATLAAHTAGRTAIFAGATLLAILGVTLLLAPGKVLLSASAGAIVATVIGVSGAALATPALLVLLGRWIGPLPVQKSGALERIVSAAVTRPRLAAGLAAVPLVALALAVLGLETIAPDPRGLPATSEGAKAFARIAERGFGPGLEVVMRSPGGPLTATRTLRLERRLERRLAELPAVRAVAGPAPLGAAFTAATGRQIAQARRTLRRARRGVASLRDGLGEATAGAESLRTGGASAGSGATRLAAGAGEARAGAEALTAGGEQAQRGAGQLLAGIDRAGAGVATLTDGARELESGASRSAAGAARLAAALRRRLVPGLERIAPGLQEGATALTRLREPAQVASAGVANAYRELRAMTAGKLDFRYEAALTEVATALAALSGRDPRDNTSVREGYDGLDPALAAAVAGLTGGAQDVRRVADGGRRAARGAGRLRAATTAVAGGTARLGDGIATLAPGLDQLGEGVAEAEGGLDALTSGGGRLGTGLGVLEQRIGELAAGLGQLEAGQAQLVTGLRGAVEELAGDPLAGQAAKAPALLASGFATIAALDTATALRRAAGRYVLDIDRGGTAARVIVLTSLTTADPRAASVVDRAAELTADFARATGVDAAVGGLAPSLEQFSAGTRNRLPLIVIGIALITFVVLVPVLRSLLLPAIVVGLNLLTVAASFGVLCLLFVGEDALLGNTGALDVISVCSAFAVIFALSIDYQVFLLARMREGYVLTQDATEAIRFGVERTGRIVTGAALIMLGTFAAFGATDVASIQQFGIGLTVAILLDATAVRLVLLPAVMRLVGARAWWLPDWAERRLPELDVEGVAFVRTRDEIGTRAAEVY